MFLIDSHCHLNKLDYTSTHKDLNDVLEKAAIHDVKFCLSVATTLADYYDTRELVGKRSDVAFSCGVHPLMIQKVNYKIDDLYYLAAENDVVAIGETGLDYYHSTEIKLDQQESFRNHIRVGCKLNKPIIIHTRNAYSDTLMILKEEKAINCGGVLHCFTENKEIAGELLDLGFYISFTGIVTFHNASRLHDIVRYIPLDRLLIETDAPYLTPVPHRGKENQPAMVRDVANYIAKLKGIALDELAYITTKNFTVLFNINCNSINN